MNCPKCGAPLSPNARFCTSCGAQLGQPAAMPPQPPMPPQGPSMPPPMPPQGPSMQPPMPPQGPPPAYGYEAPPSQSMADVFDNRPGERIDLPDPPVVGTGVGPSGMRYKIIGTTLQAVVLEVPPGQQVYSERGGMSWMSANVQMQTNMEGGFGGAFKRMFTGESLFMVTFTPQGGTGVIGFSAEFPGKVVPLNLGPGQSVICQKDGFMCAERSVTLDIHFRRKLGAGLFGGEGFIMQRITGPGVAFVEFDGEVVEYTLGPDQMLKVDTGHVAMYEPTVNFDVEMMRGFKNILFGGEGLFLATLRGPGRVWLQTMPAMNLAKKLAQYMPTSTSSSGGASINLGNLFSND